MREFEAATVRRRDESDRDITIAWYVAMLSRQEKVPPLTSLLSSNQAPEKQTLAEQQREAFKRFSEYYQIPLREVNH